MQNHGGDAYNIHINMYQLHMRQMITEGTEVLKSNVGIVWKQHFLFANPQDEPGGKGTSEMCHSFLNFFFIGTCMHFQNFCMHIFRQLVYDAHIS